MSSTLSTSPKSDASKPGNSAPHTSTSAAASRSHSVRFSNPPSPKLSPRTSHNATSGNLSGAESSADEITPIVSRERGNGKGRKYDSVVTSGAESGSGNVQHFDNNTFGGKSKAALQETVDRDSTIRKRPKKNGATSSSHRTATGNVDDGEEEDNGSFGSRFGAWTRHLADKYGSIELDNKGSVARDHLALERTFLAWLRTSLAFASIGIAVTQLFRLNSTINEGKGYKAKKPSTSVHLRQLGKPLGATFLGIAILVLLLGSRRYFESQFWIIRGKFPASRGSVFLLTFIAVALIITSLVLVCVVDPSAFEKK